MLRKSLSPTPLLTFNILTDESCHIEPFPLSRPPQSTQLPCPFLHQPLDQEAQLLQVHPTPPLQVLEATPTMEEQALLLQLTPSLESLWVPLLVSSLFSLKEREFLYAYNNYAKFERSAGHSIRYCMTQALLVARLSLHSFISKKLRFTLL